ncbi:class I adenylate-forming enzyme family protein [Mycobacterium sp. 94-17]|uniref:class I adenylate-forming enzyme family protein n=1 Tax=Mycobacterium sp. 94-17 TaxID=2986147 RepID=UPI002D1E642B|nr:AMP-binding protein [Mycobacterium sp. 94-17]MEB4208043.1 AMP-binding protein [Mycobacterium sp. 94-17]
MPEPASLPTRQPPMPEAGVPYGEQVLIRAQNTPDAVAIVVVHIDDTETTLTWHALERGANQWARLFSQRGLTAGDMVALAVPNSPELVLATLASWKLGAIPVPMRWDLPEWERARLLEVIRPALILTEEVTAEYTRAAQRLPDEPVDIHVSPATNGICSSGSTGLPKVILNAAPTRWTPQLSEPFMAQWRPVTQPQTILVPAPLYHTNGFLTLNYLLGGDRLVLLEKFSAPRMLTSIERHRVTNFTATPTMLSRIADLDDVDQRDLSSIDWILQGAAVMPEALLRRWFELLSPEQIVMAYGMTENLGLTAIRGDEWLQHPGSVGRGFRDTEIRIANADGTPVPPGQVGEICLRAPMTGGYRYLGGAQPLPTTRDGFTSAGDLGHLDADGYLYIADRRTDMIVTGGANVFPAEVESALLDHDDIVDVVVIGLSDDRWGRRVHAVVQPRDVAHPPTPDSVIEFAKAKLASYKAPKTVEFVGEIPRSAATKVNRSAMVQQREAAIGSAVRVSDD